MRPFGAPPLEGVSLEGRIFFLGLQFSCAPSVLRPLRVRAWRLSRSVWCPLAHDGHERFEGAQRCEGALRVIPRGNPG